MEEPTYTSIDDLKGKITKISEPSVNQEEQHQTPEGGHRDNPGQLEQTRNNPFAVFAETNYQLQHSYHLMESFKSSSVLPSSSFVEGDDEQRDKGDEDTVEAEVDSDNGLLSYYEEPDSTIGGAVHNESFDDEDGMIESPYEVSPHLVDNDKVEDIPDGQNIIEISPYLFQDDSMDGGIKKSPYEVSPSLIDDDFTTDNSIDEHKVRDESPYEISPHLVDEDSTQKGLDRDATIESSYEVPPHLIEDEFTVGSNIIESPYEISPESIEGVDAIVDDMIVDQDSDGNARDGRDIYEISPDDIDEDGYESFDDDSDDDDGLYCNHIVTPRSSYGNHDEQDYYTAYKKNRTCRQCHPQPSTIEDYDNSFETAYLTVDVLFGKDTLLRHNKLKISSSSGEKESPSFLHDPGNGTAVDESNYEVSFSDELGYSESDYLTLDGDDFILENGKNNNNNDSIQSGTINHLCGESIYEISPDSLLDHEDLEEDDDDNEKDYYEAVNENFKRSFKDYEDHLI